MWLPKDQTKWSSRFRLVELGRFVDTIDPPRLVRERTGPPGQEVPVYIPWDDVNLWRAKHGNRGLYTSVFHHDRPDVDAQRLGNFYFDLDNKHDPTIAQADAVKLVEYLRQHLSDDALRIYFTGEKGFHIEAEAMALGLGPIKDLPGFFRYVANGLVDELKLTSVDFVVYEPRRMWRLPNSQHQKTGLYKVHLLPADLKRSLEEIKDIAHQPDSFVVPDQKFEAKANEWWREWSYRLEMSKHTPLATRAQRFVAGQSRYRGRSTKAHFTPRDLFDHCPVMLKWWGHAEQHHDLPHEVRLFLCSILTYSPEAEDYLHAILSNCDDYDPHRTQAHIDDWKRRRELGIGGRPFSCDKANQMRVGCGECNLQPMPRYERVGDQFVTTGETASPSPVRFAYTYKRS